MAIELKELDHGRIIELRTTGGIMAEDLTQLAPAFKRFAEQYGQLNLLLELNDFHGWAAEALTAESKFEPQHFAHIARLAIVGDNRWREEMAAFCKPFMMAQIRFFTPEQRSAAREWLTSQPKHSTGVAVFPNHQAAEAAVKELQRAGFDLKQFSIVGRDYHSEDHVVGYYNMGDRMKAWGKMGAFWGGIWGLLFGTAFFLIPGLGPVLLAGPLVASLVAALEGAIFFGGLSALGAALFSIGVPRDSVLRYETQLKSGSYLLVANGTFEELQRIENLLLKSNPAQSFEIHSPAVAIPKPIRKTEKPNQPTRELVAS